MMYFNLVNMTYCNMSNKELLDAYNASAEYGLTALDVEIHVL